MPSEEATSNVAIVRTRCYVDAPLFGQYVGSETVISKKYSDGWLYVLKHENAKSFNEFDTAINELDQRLLAESNTTESFFIPDSHTKDKVLIGVSGSAFLDKIFDQKTKQFRKSVEVWRMQNIVPPRKRVAQADTSLIPGLEKLSKQLHVDFSINVHGCEGKRKREPTHTIYEDIAKREQKPKRTYKKRSIASNNTPSKAELIKAMQDTLAMKDELIKTQTAIIATLGK